MSYAFSFRWLRFALIAILGSLAAPIALVIAWFGHPERAPFGFFLTFIPFMVWYLLRAGRDRAAFEADRGALK